MNPNLKISAISSFIAGVIFSSSVTAISMTNIDSLLEQGEFDRAYGALMEIAENPLSHTSDVTSKAMERLGDMYAGATGVIGDHREALRWYREAASLGNAGAADKGNNIIELYDRAMRAFDRNEPLEYIPIFEYLADTYHHVDAMYYVGFVNAHAVSGMHNNYPKAERYLVNAATRGHSEAQAILAFLYHEQFIEATDERMVENLLISAHRESETAKALSAVYQSQGHYRNLVPRGRMTDWLSIAVDLGMPDAFYYLAMTIGPETEEGRRLLQRGANIGSANAQFKMAMLIKQEAGSMTSDAISFISRASANGHQEASSIYADFLAENGAHADALRFYREAASRGDNSSQLKVAEYLWNGIGTARNREEALSWLVTASRDHYGEAFRQIAERLLEAENPNVVGAVHMLRLGATNRDYVSALRLAELHYNQQLFPRDTVRAYFWTNIAAGLNAGQVAADMRTRIGSMLPEDIMLEAERASIQWINQHVR